MGRQVGFGCCRYRYAFEYASPLRAFAHCAICHRALLMVMVKFVRIRMVMHRTVLKERVIPDGVSMKWFHLCASVRGDVSPRSANNGSCRGQIFAPCDAARRRLTAEIQGDLACTNAQEYKEYLGHHPQRQVSTDGVNQ